MKRLFILALFAVAAWYGWKHKELFTAGSSHSEAVLINSGSRAMLRVRLTVDGQTYVEDAIEPEAHAVFPIPVTRHSDFRLRWDWRGLEGSPEWRGGEIDPGPPRSRCTLTAFDDNGITCNCVPIPTAAGAR